MPQINLLGDGEPVKIHRVAIHSPKNVRYKEPKKTKEPIITNSPTSPRRKKRLAGLRRDGDLSKYKRHLQNSRDELSEDDLNSSLSPPRIISQRKLIQEVTRVTN